MTDPQLHHARWLEIESVVVFWDILLPPVHSSRKRRNIFSYYNPNQKRKKQLKDFIKMILYIHTPQLHLNYLTPSCIETVRLGINGIQQISFIFKRTQCNFTLCVGCHGMFHAMYCFEIVLFNFIIPKTIK